MQIMADLHLHSKYSRAVSQQMILPEMARWAQRKGIDLLGTGDFTHPLWFREMKANLEEAGEGMYKLKSQSANLKTTAQNSNLIKETLFVLSTEISSIYSQGGKLRRIHNLVFSPDLKTVEKINHELLKKGTNLSSDGRPVIGLSAKDLLELVLGVNKNCLLIPAHIWTPWFSLYGSESGFDSLEECFGEMSQYIYGVETGLSSDPEMNWRIKEIESRAIISFSDAHSGPKLGREATVFEVEDIKKLRYEDIRRAIMEKWEVRGLKLDKDVGSEKSHFSPHISYTIEFYPEEGKYHFTGHRNCKVRQSPEETKKLGKICPVCGRPLTVGVMHRVQQLAKLQIANCKLQIDEFGVRWLENETQNRPPYVMLVPLLEILSESLESLSTSQKVINEYIKLTENFGGEFSVLLKTGVEEIAKTSGEKVAEGIGKIRKGEIVVDPGYDGEYGVVRIWPLANAQEKTSEEKTQLNLFS